MAAIDKDLLAVLACPETREPLAEAGAELLARLNERIRQGGVKNKGGEAVSTTLEGALVRSDGQRAYPIRDGIPRLLIDEGIAL